MADVKTSFPLHWYIFFGIIEPASVIAGAVYAVVFQDKYYNEIVPTGYLAKVSPTKAAAAAAVATAQRGVKSFWKVATQESTGFSGGNAASSDLITSATISAPSRMALGQLGSCYFLLFLNSALMLYFIRKHFAHSPVSQEKVLYAFFFVLGAADWTHILLTIHYLPAIDSSKGFLTGFASKLLALSDYRAWNSLLFGNIIITLILFSFRTAWWFGIARDSPLAEESAGGSKRKTQ